MIKKKQLLLALLLISMFILVGCGTNKYDSFAQCLSEKGVKMYGAYWCGHCEAQKKSFSNSFENINYIECSLPNRAGQTQVCLQAEIQSYPTWEFADGDRVSSVLSFEDLSRRSGCPLP